MLFTADIKAGWTFLPAARAAVPADKGAILLKIGDYNSLQVSRLASPGAYLEYADGEILLPGKFIPPGGAAGDILEVFVYRDSEDRLVATTQKPYAVVGQFASLRCVAVAPFGAFLDWGLDKDLLVPRDCQLVPMQEGRRYVVRVSLDEASGRIIGLAKIQRFLPEQATGLAPGQKVELLIWNRTDLGYKAVVNGAFGGLLFENELPHRILVGDRCEGYVKQIRPDGRIDLTLQPQGYEELLTQTPRVVEALEKAGGYLPCNGKSDPELIRKQFGLSRKAFKKIIGALYKDRIITITDDGMRLN